MNAHITVTPFHELDRSFIRRAQQASNWELRLMLRAHLNLGQCEDLYGGGCWRCALLRRNGAKK